MVSSPTRQVSAQENAEPMKDTTSILSNVSVLKDWAKLTELVPFVPQDQLLLLMGHLAISAKKMKN